MNYKKLVKEKYLNARSFRLKGLNNKTFWIIRTYCGHVFRGKSEYRAWKAAWENINK